MTDAMPSVYFICRRCRRCCRLDVECGSIHLESVLAKQTLVLEGASNRLAQYVHPIRWTNSVNRVNCFEHVSSKEEFLSRPLRVTAEMFDIISKDSEIDHPLCEECTNALHEMTDQQLQLVEDECSDYSEFLKRLEVADEEEDLEALQNELGDLQQEEQRLHEELAALRKEEDEVQKAILEQEKDEERLEHEEEHYLRKYSRHHRDLILLEDEYLASKLQMLWLAVAMVATLAIKTTKLIQYVL